MKKNYRNKRVLFLVNSADFFISHRLPLAIELKKRDLDVHVATPGSKSTEFIESKGLIHHKIPFQRKGQNPFKELATLYKICRLFLILKPDWKMILLSRVVIIRII